MRYRSVTVPGKRDGGPAGRVDVEEGRGVREGARLGEKEGVGEGVDGGT